MAVNYSNFLLSEKAHNLRERSLETIRMARALADEVRELTRRFPIYG